MAQRLTSKTGGSSYTIEDWHSTPVGVVDLKVYRLTDPTKVIGEIHWEPGGESFRADDGDTKDELESLFRYLTFPGPTGQVFGCRKCGVPIVAPYSGSGPLTGTIECTGGHANWYTLPP